MNTGETIKIVKLSELDESYVNQAAVLLVESFYTMVKGISKDREILCRLFAPSIRRDFFYVSVENGCITGIIGISDSQTRVLSINEEACISIFGRSKGKILLWQLRKIFEKPEVDNPKSGYVDFLAASTDHRRKGIGSSLLTFSDTLGYSQMFLDVLAANTPAIRLYEKHGYELEKDHHNFLMRIVSMKKLNRMKRINIQVPADI